MSSDLNTRWWSGLPRSLLEPWELARLVVFHLHDLRKMHAILLRRDELSAVSPNPLCLLTDAFTPSNPGETGRAGLARQFASLTTSLDGTCRRLYPRMNRVYDELVAAADGIAECQGEISECMHGLSSRLAMCVIGEIYYYLPLADTEYDDRGEDSLLDRRIETIQAIFQKELGAPPLRVLPSHRDLRRLIVGLDRELCRAYDCRFVTRRFCPGDDLPLTTDKVKKVSQDYAGS